MMPKPTGFIRFAASDLRFPRRLTPPPFRGLFRSLAAPKTPLRTLATAAFPDLPLQERFLAL
ncbi:MAG: hypothetical protein LBQ12_02850 [Deltaproteobacteria bacterium]|jgi:hypothetical protein|nr:hypothetical protein [Deltaproteobacteria bacterium]